MANASEGLEMRAFIKNFLKKCVDATVIRFLTYVILRLNEHSADFKLNLNYLLWERALHESVDFVQAYIGQVLVLRQITNIWDYTIQKIKEQDREGVALEFGVFQATSLKYFAKRLPGLRFYGFDSFEGLAVDWAGHQFPKGTFNLHGKLPRVPTNVALIKGWFDQTLPPFRDTVLARQNLRFLHVDGDTYQAAKIVLEGLAGYLKPGTLVLFDELIGYPNWQNGEYKALQEVAAQHGLNYRFLAFCTQQALIEIVS
jgi:hypothetical protein